MEEAEPQESAHQPLPFWKRLLKEVEIQFDSLELPFTKMASSEKMVGGEEEERKVRRGGGISETSYTHILYD